MSLRALRKLHVGEPGIIVPSVNGEKYEDSQTNESEAKPVLKSAKKKSKKKKDPINPFELLEPDITDNGKCDDINVEGDIHVDDECDDTGNIAVSEENAVGKNKKKKKRKKNKTKQKSESELEDKDEVEESIRQVNELLGELPRSHDSSGGMLTDPSLLKSLLSIEHRNLNPDNEMRKKFGSRVVQGDQSNNRGRRGRGRVQLKNTWLSRPKDTWPHMTKTGLTMSLEKMEKDHNCFNFQHSREYQRTQFLFLDAVESLNPQNIASILNINPYHIDALLQLSEISRMGEDIPMAAELVERALYSFESSFHTMFSLTQGTCRLDFKSNENRAFYLALFRHINFIGQRGCYRTALEFCKFLLSIDPDDDPLCILLLIDFYALRSESYAFLIRMYHEWEAHRNLSQLPNFAFSVPLAMFCQALDDEKSDDRADEMLQSALLMFPGLLIPLCDKCNIVPDSGVTSHPLFGTEAQLRDPEALRQLQGLYIGRCFSCWKQPEVMSWLENNVKVVLERLKQGDPLAEEYAKKRLSRYKGTPRNIYRHIIISEIKEATASLPPEMTHTPVLSYDPLPPTDAIASYTRPERTRRVEQETGPLSMFFRSLLPNFNPDEAVDPAEAAGAVGGNPLQQGVGALMDAMRDLLNNINVPAPPREDQRDGEEDQDNPEL